MAATGSIVDAPLAAADALNAVALPRAETSYTLMVQVLQSEQPSPLIFGSLALSASAITQSLALYEATMARGRGG
ncbi:hypothetical protein [Paracidovorax konjaci]|uniref:Uncharacterized protein n=1 Tax=Paracidovorax konjaci TaxID=32040 RepID=A0A1I1Y8S3_9BURK|nr:hypothetical protein [Paracidovorax konjaci]SFE15976.1 hypothetical protein SAMN04489710_11665 [Paracidovorax konjaci]